MNTRELNAMTQGEPMWSEQHPLEVWVKEDFILPGVRPVPLLMHTTPPDTDTELDFWNLLREKLRGVVHVHKFNDLKDAGSIVVTPISIKDYILSTRKWSSVYNFNRNALASGRTVISFTGGLEYKPQQGEIVFSVSTYRCKTEKSIATPNWLYDIGTKVSPIQKPSVPSVGFVGNTRYPGKVNSILNYLPIPDSTVRWMACSLFVNRNLDLRMRRVIAAQVRRKVLTETQRASNLKTSLIERKGDYFILPQEVKKRQRSEYIQNIQNNAYRLVMRGDENSSLQLWEVMSAGRIPIIIDTNQQFPNLGSLKWEDFSVIVPYSELHRIGEIVQKFHDSMSDEEFRQACMKSRAAFEYLLPHNFILEALKNKLSSRQG
jgi:hypothetical protein